jgi:hypothetical protein
MTLNWIAIIDDAQSSRCQLPCRQVAYSAPTGHHKGWLEQQGEPPLAFSAFLRDCVEEERRNGLVAGFIAEHKVVGLSVAPLA